METPNHKDITRDIAEQKRAEVALRRSEEYFRLITENSSDIIIIVDYKATITYISQSIERFLGYKPEELIGKSGFEFIHPADLPKAIYDFGRAVLTKEVSIPNSFRVRHKDGSGRVFEGVGKNFLDNSIIAGFVMNVRDITDRRKAEEELKSAYEQLKNTQDQLIQSSKMAALGQLAGGVAHEINNPLTGVLNNVQLIKMEAEAKKEFKIEEFKELLDVIEESALRCKKITQSLLDFTHAAKKTFHPLSLNTLIDKVIGIISTEMKLANVTIRTDLQNDLPDIKGDSQLLQQVIIGLIANAKWAVDHKLESRGETGTIIIKTYQEPENKNVIVLISDNGIGIPEENLPRLFEPFFSTKAVGEGTGLGLVLIDNIVHNHKGKITVESRVNVGTTFTISFPYAN